MKLTSLTLTTLVFTTLFMSPLVLAKSSINIENFYVRATPPTVTTSAFFADITNNGEKDQVIISAHSSAAGTVELHDVILDGDIMKMRQIKQINIPAKQTTKLKPGSLHVMLFNLKQPLKENNSIDVTLVFANGEQQTLTTPVKKVMTGMNVSHH